MDQLKTHTDKRGSLTIVERGLEIPFEVVQYFPFFIDGDA